MSETRLAGDDKPNPQHGSIKLKVNQPRPDINFTLQLQSTRQPSTRSALRLGREVRPAHLGEVSPPAARGAHSAFVAVVTVNETKTALDRRELEERRGGTNRVLRSLVRICAMH